MRIALATLVASLAMLAIPQRAAPQLPRDPDLERGIAFVEAGEFDDAILALEPAAKRLAAEHGRQKDLARAYAYLAIAYLGLNHEQTAKAKFLEAINADKDLKLGADQFSPRIIELFEQARREALKDQAGSPLPAQRKRGSAKIPLIIGGVAAAAGGVALAAGAGGSNGNGDGPPVILTLTLNGLTGGTQSCSTGLFFVVSASNTRTSAVRLNRLDMTFTTTSPGCVSHSAENAGVDPTRLDVTSLPAGASNVRIKQVDLAGDLCDPPRGTPGCLWQTHAALQTDAGTFGADLQLVTSR